LEREYLDELHPPQPPPLAQSKPVSPPTSATQPTPSEEELSWVASLYQRRARMILQEPNMSSGEAERQALSNCVSEFIRRYGGSIENAARILRPLTTESVLRLR
jgi:hypothetical protein